MRRISTFIVALLLSVGTLLAQEPVKNIIYMIGDGMGLSSVSMMQLVNKYEPTIFDKAENIALQKTYSADNRVTDSAASGTALASGVKTNNTMLGMRPDLSHAESIMELAQSRGMATGVVVTTYLQHATPAAFYAHIDSRHKLAEISEQLLASKIDVAIGGGMAFFEEHYGDKREAQKAIADAGFEYVASMEELKNVDKGTRTLALVSDKEVGANSGSYLAEATAKALSLLEAKSKGKRSKRGFVLMVEGSLIDSMGHANDATAQQKEMEGFMQAVEVAVEYAHKHPDTLVVVTADHETGGLALISANADFNLSEQGVEFKWSTGGHSAEMVPIYLYGAGAELINGIMENTELNAKLKALIK
jgi:alkaline phosphatase